MKNNSRPTIAYLTNFFARNLINSEIWSGIYRMTQEEDVNLFCFPGNPPRSPIGFEAQANSLYKLINRKTIEGLIIWGAGMFGHTKPEYVQQFFTEFDEYAVVNIGPVIKGVCNITVNNYIGMFDACVHLIEHHSCRRIAFIRGPESHEEAEIRFRAYKDALRKYNIPFDPDLITDGLFFRESGVECIHTLLDERQVKFDAVAAASDLMSLGAMSELESRGIDVPGEVKIIGFDDIEESQYQKTPLTTARQPFSELGRVAVKTLLSKLSGKECGENTLVPAELRIRQSCGCLHPFVTQSTVDVKDIFPGIGQSNELPEKDKIVDMVLKDMTLSIKTGSTDKGIIENLVDRILTELQNDQTNVFLPTLYQEILNLNTQNDITLFSSLLSSLRRIILSFISRDTTRIIQMENLWQQARIIIGEYSMRLKKLENIKTDYKNIILQQINQRLVATFDIDEFMNILARELPQIGITTCFLSLYENPSESLEKSYLKLAIIDNNRINLDQNKIIYPSYEIIPGEFSPGNKKFIYLIESLFFENEQLGYVVFGGDFVDGHVHEILRAQLCAAIKGALLIEEKEKLLVRLENHAQNLQMTMKKLEQSNTELEQFSYIASHDLKEPLRKIRIFSNRLITQYENIIDEKGIDYLKRMSKAADRMQILINNLLDYSRLTTKAQPFCSVNLSHIVQEVLTDIELLIEQKQAEIIIDQLPTIDGDPNQMQQLFQNLITNGLKFNIPGQHPVIHISHTMYTNENRDYCDIIIKDNGIGIEEQHFSRIFGIFQRLHTRKEYEGTGIGLAICKKVVDRHHGRIKVESQKNNGTQFIITFPVKQPDEEAK